MDILNELKRIEHDAIALGAAIRNEGKVCREELQERLRLGLEGKAAIEHYNAWMLRNGLNHLIVEE